MNEEAHEKEGDIIKWLPFTKKLETINESVTRIGKDDQQKERIDIEDDDAEDSNVNV